MSERRKLVGQALIVLVFVLITVFVIYRDNGVREMMTNPPPTTILTTTEAP